MSDVEDPGFEMLQKQWEDRGVKRAADTDAREGGKRKVRTTIALSLHQS